jgi:hypothetical protein
MAASQAKSPKLMAKLAEREAYRDAMQIMHELDDE